MTTLARASLSVFLGTLLSMSAAAQSSAPKVDLLSEKVAYFELTDQTLFDGLAKLSAKPTPLAFGFEEVLKAKFSDPPTRNPQLSLRLERKTVREILDALCSMDSRYTWSLDGRTINVYPRSIVGNHSYLLNRKVARLELKELTDPYRVLWLIADELPPPKEQVGYAQIGGDPSYPKPWTVTFENLTVRQIINRVAAHSDPRGSWTFSGSPEFRAFSFRKTGFQHMESQGRPQDK